MFRLNNFGNRGFKLEIKSYQDVHIKCYHVFTHVNVANRVIKTVAIIAKVLSLNLGK